jgi:transposase-like protein
MAGRDRMTIEEVVRQVLRDEHGDVIRESVRAVAQELMEAEISELIGAQHGERTEDRATHRNGYRPRRWDTRAGEIELQIPKMRQGSYFPSFLQPRKRSEQALVSVVQQAYVCGVSTRRVDRLVGVQLAISDAHPGLKAAIARVLGSAWQRCTVHFLRDLRGHCRKDQHDALGALIRQLFTAADGVQARRRLRDAIGQLESRLPKIARLLDEAEDDVLAFYAFPAEHWPKLRSTNPLERFNREIGRRTDVVGIFPDDPSLIRLVSMLAIEANDEWLVGRSYISQGSMALLYDKQSDRSLSPKSEEEVAELAAA